MRLARVDADGPRIHDLDARDGAQEAAEAAGRVRHLRRAAEGEGDVVRGQRAPVVPAQGFPEPELPHRVRELRPRLREAGPDLRARVALHQRAVDVLVERVVRPEVVEVRVERGDGRRAAQGERLRVRGGGEAGGQEEGDEAHGGGCSQDVSRSA